MWPELLQMIRNMKTTIQTIVVLLHLLVTVAMADTINITVNVHNAGNFTRQLQITWAPAEYAGTITETGSQLFSIEPGQTLNFNRAMDCTVDAGSCIMELGLFEQARPHTEAGYSLLNDGDATFTALPGGLGAYEWQIGPAYNGGNPPPPFEVEWTPGYQPTETPADKRSLWMVTDGTLSADVYREGIDKVVYASNSKTGEVVTALKDLKQSNETSPFGDWTTVNTDIANKMIDAAEAMKVAVTGQVQPITDTVTANVGEITATPISAAPSTDGMSLGTIELPAIGASISLAFVDRWPSMDAIGVVCRELLLTLAVMLWAVRMRDVFLYYLNNWYKITNVTTQPQPEPVVSAPIGWGKQLLTVGVMVGALLTVIGTAIYGTNSYMGEILSGASMSTIWSMSSSVISSVAGNSLFTMGYALVAHFVPIAAIGQLFISAWFLEWTMPGIFGVCFGLAKFFRI